MKEDSNNSDISESEDDSDVEFDNGFEFDDGNFNDDIKEKKALIKLKQREEKKKELLRSADAPDGEDNVRDMVRSDVD